MATPMVQTSSLTLVVVVENGELAPDVVAQIVDDDEDIWNAAQRQMARTGKMHGFMRACTGPSPKKILEWYRVVARSSRGPPACHLPQRPLLHRRARPERVRGLRLGNGWAIIGVHTWGSGRTPHIYI